ncbi:hypothetical protein JHV666_49520 [Mycobacterium avium subsp. hominissuis]
MPAGRSGCRSLARSIATPSRFNSPQLVTDHTSALSAAKMLADEWDVAADVWSVTSWGELNRDGVT